MKTLKIATILAFTGFAATAQNITTAQVPAKIMADFQKNYSQAKAVEWEMKDNHYQVEFNIGNYDHEISYNNEGTVLKMEKDINPVELPAGITKMTTSKYPEFKIDSVEMIKEGNKTTYKVEIEQGWFKERNLVFDDSNKLISDLED